jgi:hypothetical protein
VNRRIGRFSVTYLPVFYSSLIPIIYKNSSSVSAEPPARLKSEDKRYAEKETIFKRKRVPLERHEHLQCYRLRFRPLDSPEEDLVHNLAANRWRFVRLQTLESSLMDTLPATGERMATWRTAFSDPGGCDGCGCGCRSGVLGFECFGDGEFFTQEGEASQGALVIEFEAGFVAD